MKVTWNVDLTWMTLNSYKFEFSPKFALSNFKCIRQVAALSRVTIASAGLSCFDWLCILRYMVDVTVDELMMLMLTVMPAAAAAAGSDV